MTITAKVINRLIDTGKVISLVQAQNQADTIVFQIRGEDAALESYYFYIMYKRPSDTIPHIQLLGQPSTSGEYPEVSFSPGSYFTAEDGTVKIQLLGCDASDLTVDPDTGTISGSTLWESLQGFIVIHASQLDGSETIIEENVLTEYLAAFQELDGGSRTYASDAEEFARGTRSDGQTVPVVSDDANDNAKYYKGKAKEWATKTGAPVEGVELSAKGYALVSETRANEAEGYAIGTKNGSPAPAFSGKNAKELASDAQDWAKGTRSDGKTPSHTSDSAKAYAESAADSAAIVSAHAEAIDAIGDDLTNIDAVAADILDDDSSIDAVAANITNVNAVAANETNINAVNTNKTNINTVAGKATEITTVAGIASDVSAVAAIASDVAAVEDIDDDVSAVAAIAVDVGVVADAATDVAAVADGITDVGTVATNISDVGAVASDITKIAAVADDLTNIDAVADDLANIDAADEHALEAEGWANGTQNGTDVGSSSPYYHNNAKYWAGSVPALQSKVEANSKRITNLEQKAGDEIVVDYPSSTYGMDEVPASVAEYAKVTKLRGVSRAENNIFPIYESSQSYSANNVTVTDNRDGSYTVQTTGAGASDETYPASPYPLYVISGHKYLIAGCPSNGGLDKFYDYVAGGSVVSPNPAYDIGSGCIFTAIGTGYANVYYWRVAQGAVITTPIVFKPFIRDLTQYFSSDPSVDVSTLTISDIQSNYPELLIPSDYDAGSLVSTTYSAVKSVGVNIWDEEWESGLYNQTTGEKQANGNYGRSKNLIPVTPNQSYYFLVPTSYGQVLYFAEFDADGNYIGYSAGLNSAVQIPSNCVSIGLYMYGWTSNNHDIQICDNSLPDAVKTTYHPYTTATLSLPSPVELRSAGSVADTCELNVEVNGVEKRRQTTRVYAYTITGNENFDYGHWDNDTISMQYATTDHLAKSYGACLCPFYQNMQLIGNQNGTYVRWKNGTNNWASLDAFKADAVGKTITWELAEEVVTLSDPILDPFIEVEGGGTIEPVQSQSIKIDHAFTAEYLAV